MLLYSSLVLGLLNLSISIMIYRKLSLTTFENREDSQQKYEDSNIQNILNSRLLDIQNRRYSVRTNLGMKNGS